MSRRVGFVALVAYVGSVIAANWAVEHYGLVPVGFGLMAPAGVYVVGVAFTLRDVVQRSLGKWAALGAIAVGAAVSYFISPALAFASAVAFGFSELADFAVYTPLQKRGWLRAVAASNLVGIVVDSVLFLWLAFRSLEFLPGQIVGKAWMTAAAIVLLAVIARRREPVAA